MKNHIILILFLLSTLFILKCVRHEIILLENNLQGVQHLGIPVHDIEQSKAWYTEKLGFRVVHEPMVPWRKETLK